MTAQLGYADVADRYRDAGIASPLPLPPGKKDPPPEGWTGADAVDPSMADIQSWKMEHPHGNVALRVADCVIGIDIDAYEGKLGRETYRRLVEKLGPLPATWRSTSRTESGSGIYFYRVPPGLRFKGDIGKNLQIIQRGYRYACVWPSIHPNGNQYRWYDVDTNLVTDGRVPTLDDLAALPDEWVEALLRSSGDLILFPEDEARVEMANWDDKVRADYLQAVHEIEHGAGRHETMIATVMRLLNDEVQQRVGALTALAMFHDFFIEAITATGQRAESDIVSAEAEWDRAVKGGQELAAKDPPLPPMLEVDEIIGFRESDKESETAKAETQTLSVLHLRAFIEEPAPTYDWLISDLLERQDRLILTGVEGGGKSTLKRQIGVQGSAGIHPFTLEDIDPIRSIHLDLENGYAMSKRKFTELHRVVADRLADDMHYPVIRPQGLDLQDGADRRWLHSLVIDLRPDLILVGPIYKLWSGDPRDEEPARNALLFLDALRADYGIAIILEAHTRNEDQGQKRSIRPYGASIQRRWPEFGLHISAEGVLTHWRGARDEREWPLKLMRGGRTWPWEVDLWGNREARWIDVMDACRKAGKILTEREIADATGISKTTVHRSIDANRAEWHLLEQELEEPE